MSFNLF